MAENTVRRRAPRNRTIDLCPGDLDLLRGRLVHITRPAVLEDVLDRTIHGDVFQVLERMPHSFADLIFLDPPYNLTKYFNGTAFQERSIVEYRDWLHSWFSKALLALKPKGSAYICGDWRSSSAIYEVATESLKVRNRITWEREKGRGAESNWKMCSEDIWFCTRSDDFTFNIDSVKLKRRVIAPYRVEGRPKDWEETNEGDYRVTHPSNIWTDLSVPFWSMPENTDHPTQKPEKLLAKIILASSKVGDVVFDPFLGSGTTSVVAKKLGRHFLGIEKDETYCLLAEKRLEMANHDKSIQGFAEGIFWERNSAPDQNKGRRLTDEQQALPLILRNA